VGRAIDMIYNNNSKVQNKDSRRGYQ